eukprot:CAMPEP_0194217008 /NCGR_PEP_ID=MMETSP0156-20130528/20145_1 /TAXON_ID=33649 /ORGANISM="Thalassionema nitzschioides, Strain L26-B" /LENGTH=78 /DNA_ID=CAMNT_0038945917 /DNA_START=127 /DNA_END=363 /DNA_ORIENTATION=+
MVSLCCCLPASPKYEDYDWNELPEDAKKAAQTLGYTKKMWDKDKSPEGLEDKEWEQLTEEEQKAAGVLGYDESGWDAD